MFLFNVFPLCWGATPMMQNQKENCILTCHFHYSLCVQTLWQLFLKQHARQCHSRCATLASQKRWHAHSLHNFLPGEFFSEADICTWKEGRYVDVSPDLGDIQMIRKPLHPATLTLYDLIIKPCNYYALKEKKTRWDLPKCQTTSFPFKYSPHSRRQ